MSTAQVPAIDMNKLNFFIGQLVTDLGTAVHTSMVDVVAKAGFNGFRRVTETPFSIVYEARP